MLEKIVIMFTQLRAGVHTGTMLHFDSPVARHDWWGGVWGHEVRRADQSDANDEEPLTTLLPLSHWAHFPLESRHTHHPGSGNGAT